MNDDERRGLRGTHATRRLQHLPRRVWIYPRREINYYIYENTRRGTKVESAFVFTEVGPLERRLRSTDSRLFLRTVRREKDRERAFVPLDRRACIAPRLYSSDQK